MQSKQSCAGFRACMMSRRRKHHAPYSHTHTSITIHFFKREGQKAAGKTYR
jgi:hypothetical protein